MFSVCETIIFLKQEFLQNVSIYTGCFSINARYLCFVFLLWRATNKCSGTLAKSAFLEVVNYYTLNIDRVHVRGILITSPKKSYQI